MEIRKGTPRSLEFYKANLDEEQKFSEETRIRAMPSSVALYYDYGGVRSLLDWN